MKLALVVATAVCCALAGCAGGDADSGVPEQPRTASVSPVNEAELRPYTGLGPGTVTGRAAIGGATCAGVVVRLVPAITAVREAYDAFNRGQHVASNPSTDMRVTAVRRQTVCDGEGRFRFANLPAGQWVVATEVRGPGQARRIVHRLVSARAGEPTEVALGERDVVSVPNARMAAN